MKQHEILKINDVDYFDQSREIFVRFINNVNILKSDWLLSM